MTSAFFKASFRSEMWGFFFRMVTPWLHTPL